MGTFQRVEEIEAWKEARELTKEIYSITNQQPFATDYALRDQIRKACISVMSNIAEGFERQNPKEFSYFLRVAKGSNGEVRTQLYIALDQEYIDQEQFNLIYEITIRIGKMVSSLQSYLISQNTHGK